MCRAVVLFLLGNLTISSIQAQTDPVETARAYQAVIDQQAEAEVANKIVQAQKLYRLSPLETERKLKHLLLSLDLKTNLSVAKRTELAKVIQTEIARVRAAAQPPAIVVRDPKIARLNQEQQAALATAQAEAVAIQVAIREIETYMSNNKFDQAQRKINELGVKYPTNPAVLVLLGQDRTATRVKLSRELAQEQADRVLLALNDVTRSALPPTGNIEYPENWKELSAQRAALEPKLDKETQAILVALQKPVKEGLENTPFVESMQRLVNLIDKPLHLDEKALEDAGIDTRRPVSYPGNVTAQTALRSVLQSLGLTYIIKDGTILVVTLEKARESLVTRSYYLGDLISLRGPFGNAIQFGPVADYQQTMANAQQLIDSIKTSVDPLSWSGGGGGNSTLFFHYPSLSLVVRAPTEVHAQLFGQK